jgi:hypothetical protein
MELNRVEERKVENFIRRYTASQISKDQRVDNSSLPAGAPMYYFCRACGQFITALPEAHFSPAPKYCDDCEDLKKEALLDEALRRARA